MDLDQGFSLYRGLFKIAENTFRRNIYLYDHSAENNQDFKYRKMVVQPMIENSLCMVFVQDREFRLLIQIKREPEFLGILVQDNGGGMDPTQLADPRRSAVPAGKIIDISAS